MMPYAYECASDWYCSTNSLGTTYPPGNLLVLVWTFVGPCEKHVDCPEEYEEALGQK